ncbi:MAG: penicillin-binding protein activator LpoB [Treponema sp.]|nr:penicillin-binding protein activator LpoB [Treponema sp.]
MKRLLCILTLALIPGFVIQAQRMAKKESLALLPFTGGAEGDGEYIVSEFARQPALRNAFNKVTLVTPTTEAVMQFEHKFQRDSGMTDADSILELGKKLNAAYVIAGYITRLGSQNLVLVSILDVVRLQQVAGDYRTYRNIEEVDTIIPDIAAKLAELLQRDTADLPGLSVPPFEISTGVNENDSQVLAQILACELANGDRYAVLPRTDTLEKVMEEHKRQRSGETDQERVKRLGAGRNAQFVLSGAVARLGQLNKFGTDILNIEDGSFIDGYSEQYNDFAEGIDLMPKLAANLNGAASAITAQPAPAANPAPVVNLIHIDRPRQSGDFSGGRRFGAGVLNLALGLGSFTMGDWGGGLIVLGGYGAAAGLIVFELSLAYDDDLAGYPGAVGLAVAGATVIYGFIAPLVYHRSPKAAAALERLSFTVLPGETGTASVSYSWKF